MNSLTASTYKAMEANPFLFGYVYFRESHFRDPSPKFHVNLIQSACQNRHLAVAAPRESAKSTMLAFLYMFHTIMFKRKKFIVIIGNTFEKASEPLDAIKKELADNEKLREDFPNLRITKDAKGDSEFRHADKFETRVLCKGVEQVGSVRGAKFKAYRPDLIIGDDMEDDELVRSKDRRIQLRNEFDQALIPAGDRHTCQYIFIGTVLHDDAQIAHLVSPTDYPEYKKIVYKALNRTPEGEEYSLWPEKWTVDALHKIRDEKPSVFAKEYQNDPVDERMAKFHRKDFRYWMRDQSSCVLFGDENEVLAKYDTSECKPAIACDMAWEEKKHSDYSVILPGLLTPERDILLEEYICKKGMRPHELEEILFTMVERLERMTGETVPIGFEKAKLEKVMKHLLKEAMRKRNKFLLFKDLQWDKDKISRIVTRLEPRYAQHTIFHKKGMGELEEQLLRIPSGTHDDLPDSLQGLVQLLNYPKMKSKKQPTDDMFDKLIKYTKGQTERQPFHGFGKKKKYRGFDSIPARRALW